MLAVVYARFLNSLYIFKYIYITVVRSHGLHICVTVVLLHTKYVISQEKAQTCRGARRFSYTDMNSSEQLENRPTYVPQHETGST